MPRWRRWWYARWRRFRRGRRTDQSGSWPGGHLALQCAADLARVRAAALADRDVQGLPGPAADRQDPRCGGLVPLPAPLHPGLLVVDQPGRAVVRRIAETMPRTRGVLLAGRAHHRARR